jgi:hypothetical protein
VNGARRTQTPDLVTIGEQPFKLLVNLRALLFKESSELPTVKTPAAPRSNRVLLTGTRLVNPLVLRLAGTRLLPMYGALRHRQVRRLALDARRQPIEPVDDTRAFSELIMYVLVRRQGTWWLAAGQNTPVRPGTQG